MRHLKAVFSVPSAWCALLFWASGFFCITAASQSSSQIEGPNIRVDVNLATLKFMVKETDGRLLNHLNQGHFRVFEGGALQEIVFFEPPRNTEGEMGPLRLAFLIDMSGSTLATRAEELAAAGTFLDSLHDFTEVGIFGFSDKLMRLQDFTSTRSLAQKALTESGEHLGPTALYDSLNALILRMKDSPRATQNVVILISDGMDNAYRIAPQSISLAQRNHVVIYTVLVPSAGQLYISSSSPLSQPGASPPAGDDREAKELAFASLSLRTNGGHFSGFETILNFDQVMAQINDDVFGNLYSIGYYTDDPYRRKEDRNIQVEIAFPKAYIPARFETLPERSTVKQEVIAALFDDDALDRVPNNLHLTFREIGADLDLLPQERQGGQIGLPFRIKISPFSLQKTEKGDIRTGFGVIARLLDQQGEEVARLREIFRVNLEAKDIRAGRGIIYTNKLFAPPGVYALKVALLEMATWNMTAFERNVRIRAR
ncbi:MAG: VWA domain-containing protein [Acidobacteria bacterium]|nr:MAG: VWA domain-containing protein [Acidobacteriota bacterium]